MFALYSAAATGTSTLRGVIGHIVFLIEKIIPSANYHDTECAARHAGDFM